MAFVLAHLSDPHLSPLPVPRLYELLGKRGTGYVNWLRRRRFIHNTDVLHALVADLKRQKANHLAVTGDLANIALPEEFRHGREWLASLSEPCDVSLVPGNHDAYVREGLDHAAREWGPYMQGDDGSTKFPYLRRRGPLALIGLSTAVPTAPLMASGSLGIEQLARLAVLLDKAKEESLFRVVLIHHPPVSDAHWHKRLTDAAALLAVIAQHGADLLLHGHDHLAMLNWLEGPDGSRVPAVGVPSASAAPGIAKEPAAYNLYEIDGEPRAWRCAMRVRAVGPAGGMTEQKKIEL